MIYKTVKRDQLVDIIKANFLAEISGIIWRTAVFQVKITVSVTKARIKIVARAIYSYIFLIHTHSSAGK